MAGRTSSTLILPLWIFLLQDEEVTFGGGGKTAGEEDLSTTVEDVKEGGMCLCFNLDV